MAITTKRIIKKVRSCSCSMPGVWRAVAHTEGAAVIYHSPKACSHISRVMDGGDHFRKIARDEYEPNNFTVPLVCSSLKEKHSIFGGIEQLRECLVYVISTYQPKFIMIANSCVAGVIGDDVVAVAQEVEMKQQVPILTVPCYGFLDGEYYAGYYYAAAAIIERLLKKSMVRPNTVLLIGDQGGPNGEYCREVKRLLQYFDVEVIGQFPTYTNYSEYDKIGESALNIVLGSRGQANEWLIKIADKLRQQLGTPYYATEFPVGWESTQKWLLGLGEVLGKKEIAKQAVCSENKKLAEVYALAKNNLHDKKCIICIGRLAQFFEPGWIINLVRKSGMIITAIIMLEAFTEKAKQEMIAKMPDIDQSLIIDQSAGNPYLDKADLILTTHELADYTAKQLFLPLLPKSGIQGEINLLQKIRFLLARRGNKGGIIYG
ncbi:MAG TPA: nitrogen fixation protein NifE [Candidatus Avacidaminococcus intestinavium]|uniref:Nitrogen fixation protein NifE n=1 Tax=Candidatus Avacidaminococcus intestinavium TaxID=2840684 RepID=A0A9D1MNX3_9FIRM|nr:nitrogen fixation protein NifE [Candidatus Avacidaminococcus intestinavium]